MPATLLKSITHRCFSKTLTLGTEELHFQTTYKIAFCSTPSFAEHQSRTKSKAKYETAIYNSVKWCPYCPCPCCSL